MKLFEIKSRTLDGTGRKEFNAKSPQKKLQIFFMAGKLARWLLVDKMAVSLPRLLRYLLKGHLNLYRCASTLSCFVFILRREFVDVLPAS